jgi:FlaA1/EpsC-like NDP-sugar epimerase
MDRHNERITDKIGFIAGGTGSFGSKAMRHLLETTNAKEFSVFRRDKCKQEQMQIEPSNQEVKFYWRCP